MRGLDRRETTRARAEAWVLPPQQVDKLLFAEDRCMCNLEWRCVPHDTCFIHNLCFCVGSGSFPPVKPPRPTWAEFSYDWYCELASHLKLHPHSPLPHFGSEVEYSPLVMPYYHSQPPTWSHYCCEYLPSLLLDNSYCLYLLIVLLPIVLIVLCSLKRRLIVLIVLATDTA